MDKAVLSLKEDFAGLRTGRASSSLLDQIMVNAYGSMVQLNTVASISVPEPRQINVNIWDKGVVSAVEKAIRNSDLGLNPVVEGNNLRIPIPPLTEERRKDLSRSPASTPRPRRSPSATSVATPTTTSRRPRRPASSARTS
jgi:ribosome recycling factor